MKFIKRPGKYGRKKGGRREKFRQYFTKAGKECENVKH